MLWKHRDTSCESNFVEHVPPADGHHGYIALFNAGDSLLSEAWIGVNDSGFAIMNTASYNLAPDTAAYKDREGALMTIALQTCSSVDDFSHLLRQLPKPLGVQANFGVVDSQGNGAFFETDDFKFRRYDLSDSPDGIIVRTNFSLSGDSTEGYGYIRYDNARHLIAAMTSDGRRLTPSDFTEGLSRSFYHSLIGGDAATAGSRWIVDQDYIPRHSSTASVVIEAAQADSSVMWVALGYPPCAVVRRATIGNIPDDIRPTLPGHRSPDAEEAIRRRNKAFPVNRGSGQRYIDLDYLLPTMKQCHNQSIINYEQR